VLNCYTGYTSKIHPENLASYDSTAYTDGVVTYLLSRLILEDAVGSRKSTQAPGSAMITDHLIQSLKRSVLFTLLLLLCLESSRISADEFDLPVLGDSISGVVSPEKEYRLGRAWLRMLQSRAPLIRDPLLVNYYENLTYRLAYNSELQDPDLELIIIDSPAINAFAVPGGILGINAGLFLNAQSEDELAGVISHELAHLSQRHFARTVEEAQKSQLANNLALLASIALIAASDGDAGLAALATTQAANIQAQLKFSRRNEQEADRVGMRTLVETGMNPLAMSLFFERLQKASEFLGTRPPEYLLTHPVTESRIADSRSRARAYPSKNYFDNLEFQLMKARTKILYSKDIKSQVNLLKQTSLKGNTLSLLANKYALALAYVRNENLSSARNIIKELLIQDPNRITFIATYADIETKSGNINKAIQILEDELEKNPGNLPLTFYYSEALIKQGSFDKAIKVLRGLSLKRPKDIQTWEYLEKAYGEAKDIIGVHRARAEVLFLKNQTKIAIEQLEFALKLVKYNYPLTAKIKGRIEYFQYHSDDLKL